VELKVRHAKFLDPFTSLSPVTFMAKVNVVVTNVSGGGGCRRAFGCDQWGRFVSDGGCWGRRRQGSRCTGGRIRRGRSWSGHTVVTRKGGFANVHICVTRVLRDKVRLGYSCNSLTLHPVCELVH